MKRVLLTGASGFIGRHCIAPLLARGYEVHALSSQPVAQSEGGVTWHQVSLFDEAGTRALLAEVQPTELLHMAWYVAHGKFWHAAENLAWVRASLYLVEQFHAYGGQRAVVAGTCAEYDWRYGHCVEQLTPLQPATLYGTSKHALQSLLTAYALRHGLSLAWGRIFFLYGPHEPATRFVASVIRALLADEVARCSHGRQIRDLLHVQDVAAAFVALLNSSVEGAVNIGSGRPTSLADVALQIGALLGQPERIQLGALAAPADDPPLLLADVRRLNQEVGWQPAYSLEAGLEQSIAWWRSQMAAEKE